MVAEDVRVSVVEVGTAAAGEAAAAAAEADAVEAGGVEAGAGEAGATEVAGAMEAVLRGEVAELRETLALERAALQAERAVRAELHGRLLGAYRRALLAEQHGQVVEELVQGDSVEALDAAVARAREAHARVVATVRVAQATAPVPVGNVARTGPRLEGLSPQAKIAAALRSAE